MEALVLQAIATPGPGGPWIWETPTSADEEEGFSLSKGAFKGLASGRRSTLGSGDRLLFHRNGLNACGGGGRTTPKFRHVSSSRAGVLRFRRLPFPERTGPGRLQVETEYFTAVRRLTLDRCGCEGGAWPGSRLRAQGLDRNGRRCEYGYLQRHSPEQFIDGRRHPSPSDGFAGRALLGCRARRAARTAGAAWLARQPPVVKLMMEKR